MIRRRWKGRIEVRVSIPGGSTSKTVVHSAVGFRIGRNFLVVYGKPNGKRERAYFARDRIIDWTLEK